MEPLHGPAQVPPVACVCKTRRFGEVSGLLPVEPEQRRIAHTSRRQFFARGKSSCGTPCTLRCSIALARVFSIPRVAEPDLRGLATCAAQSVAIANSPRRQRRYVRFDNRPMASQSGADGDKREAALQVFVGLPPNLTVNAKASKCEKKSGLSGSFVQPGFGATQACIRACFAEFAVVRINSSDQSVQRGFQLVHRGQRLPQRAACRA